MTPTTHNSLVPRTGRRLQPRPTPLEQQDWRLWQWFRRAIHEPIDKKAQEAIEGRTERS